MNLNAKKLAKLDNKLLKKSNLTGITNTSALKAVHTAAIAAAGVAASPIPFTDATLLVPIQSAMIAAIYRAYGNRISDGAIKGVLTAIATTSVARSVAGNIIKIIPGVGTVLGATMNASVAVAFTELMGLSIAAAFENDEIDNTNDLLNTISKATGFFKK